MTLDADTLDDVDDALGQVDASILQIRPAGSRVLRGLVEMTNEEYHAAPGTSKSHLDSIDGRSAKNYWQDYLNPNRPPRKMTPALKLGQAIHCAMLEPDELPDRYAIEPDIDKRSNAGKAAYAAFVRENFGKTLLSESDYQVCLGIRDATHANPKVSGLLTGGVAEKSYFAIDPETGELIKCRVDYLVGGIDGLVVDLKSTTHAGKVAFGKSANDYRYDLQPPWYFDVFQAEFGTHPKQFVWIAFEKEPPFAMGIYYATPEQIEAGRRAARRDFMRIVHHKRLNYWPDYSEEILPLELPTWTRR